MDGFYDPKLPDFKRRIPWMFPDDGCPIRAEWVVRKAFQRNASNQFSKIFLFGELDLDTPYHPEGKISCWYHEAAGIIFQGVTYVFEQSVDATQPLAVNNWAERIGHYTFNTLVSVCTGGSLDPSSLCDEKPFEMSSPVAVKTVHSLLNKEHARVGHLGLNPSQVLGE
ncbi:MAG: hypothetical protein KA715_07370 [Xanthomonadaceae bacterium]|nr:hypothetical protein [Xanthomonadaceae bacterium]